MSSSTVNAPENSAAAGDEDVICNICSKAFPTARGLRTHKRIHNHNPYRDPSARRPRGTEHVCYMAECYRRGKGLTSTHTLEQHLRKKHDATVQENEAARQAWATLARQAPAAQNDGAPAAQNDGPPQRDEEMQDVAPGLANEAKLPPRAYEEITEIHASYKRKLRTLLVETADKSKEEMVKEMWEFYDSMPL
ncbi:hypothetical protein PG984_005158 [Apiospora sp. TS-2023a]